jgi:hypothetical protein
MRTFLRCHTADSRIAEALKTAIETKLEGSEVFVAHRDLRYGAPWRPQLQARIAGAGQQQRWLSVKPARALSGSASPGTFEV